jgi:ATP-dependent HslUV protease ATP-binding subunit HslU
VESIIRDLTELAVSMVREEETEKVQVKAREQAEEKVLDLLLPNAPSDNVAYIHGGGPETMPESKETREKLRRMLRAGQLDEREVEIEPQRSGPSATMFEVITPQDMEEAGIDIRETINSMLGGGGRDQRPKKASVKEALELFAQQEAQSLIDIQKVHSEAVRRVEENGIVFLDEIDKICGREGATQGPDVSREGVQRDLLPIVEGSSVKTRQGMVRTDHILFIASGAFNLTKPSDLIPEFQGRFPVRVELEALTKADFVRILTEPQNALTRQYVALLATENFTVTFEDSAVDEIAGIATEVNTRAENVGARRLHTILERVLDEVSFQAPEHSGGSVTIDAAYVRERLGPILVDQDLSRYILGHSPWTT